ncbi:hypothetical protein QTO34_007979 [Cnephaeus nilssonii]|uniref:Uncharacterized protein n=1 Tax=Cnephaeus nilssonii TaxID=3371016 RepID=A0AA40I9V0_CNENI|nr:hypothetical protein QTO34_007979 [Eptesicus nilssonii]
MVIRFFKNFLEKADKFSETLEDMKKDQLEIKHTLTEIKNIIQRPNSRLEDRKNQVKDLKYKEAKNTQLEKQKEKRIQKVEDSHSEAMICEKMKMLHTDLLKDSPGMSAESDSFKASRGWFEFQKRTADNFMIEFQVYVEAEGFVPNKCSVVMRQASAGRKWQRGPTSHRRSHCWTQANGDRLTSLLCGNASGDFKSKPLLIYHSENP